MENILSINSIRPFILLITILLINACKIPQGSKIELGKKYRVADRCFCRCEIPVYERKNVQSFAIFTGNHNKEKVALDSIEIATGKAMTKWVKKKADKNCLSSDPNDCLVWCLVEVPAKREKIIYLQDTTQTDNFYTRKIVLKQTHRIDRIEMICEEDITDNLLNEIEVYLINNGYPILALDQDIKTRVSNKLYQYQLDNLRPTCGFDLSTIEHLRIEIKKDSIIHIEKR